MYIPLVKGDYIVHAHVDVRYAQSTDSDHLKISSNKVCEIFRWSESVLCPRHVHYTCMHVTEHIFSGQHIQDNLSGQHNQDNLAATRHNRPLKNALTFQWVSRGQNVRFEPFIEVFTEAHVLEHPLQFTGVLESTRLLEEDSVYAHVHVHVTELQLFQHRVAYIQYFFLGTR